MDEVVIDGVKAKVARTFYERARGLIGRKKPPSGEGLLILKCNAVHTFFMTYPIDLRFYDRNGGLVKEVKCVKPWNPFVWGGLGAAKVLETASQ